MTFRTTRLDQSSPPLTRRRLLSSGVLAAAAGLWYLMPFGARPALAQEAEHILWSALVGQTFGLAAGPAQRTAPGTALELQEVALCAYRGDHHRPRHLRPAAISLLFSCPVATELAASIYTLTHPRLGRVELYLDRLVRADSPHSAIYEAVLN